MWGTCMYMYDGVWDMQLASLTVLCTQMYLIISVLQCIAGCGGMVLCVAACSSVFQRRQNLIYVVCVLCL